MLEYSRNIMRRMSLVAVCSLCVYEREGGSDCNKCGSGLVCRVRYSGAGDHRSIPAHLHFQIDNKYLVRDVLVNRCWEPAHNIYYILTKPQTVP